LDILTFVDAAKVKINLSSVMFIPLIQCWCEIKYLITSFEIAQFCPGVQKDKCVGKKLVMQKKKRNKSWKVEKSGEQR